MTMSVQNRRTMLAGIGALGLAGCAPRLTGQPALQGFGKPVLPPIDVRMARITNISVTVAMIDATNRSLEIRFQADQLRRERFPTTRNFRKPSGPDQKPVLHRAPVHSPHINPRAIPSARIEVDLRQEVQRQSALGQRTARRQPARTVKRRMIKPGRRPILDTINHQQRIVIRRAKHGAISSRETPAYAKGRSARRKASAENIACLFH